MLAFTGSPGPHAFDHRPALPRSDQPLVTVLMPVHDGGAHITDAVRSVLAQSYGNWELVVVDNHSDDGTSERALEAAGGDPRVRIHRHERLVPVYENHNRALSYLGDRSAYAKVLHADDFLHPECLMQMVGLAEEHPSVGLVSSFVILGDRVHLDARLPLGRSVYGGREIGRRGLLGMSSLFGNPSSVLIRVDALGNLRYNEENLHGDTELCYELLARSDFGFVHQTLSYIRMHAETVTARHRNAATMLPAHIDILIRHGRRFLTDEELARRLDAQLRRYSWVLLKRTLRGVPWRDERFLPYHVALLERLHAGARAAGAHLRARALIAPWRAVVPFAKRLRERSGRRGAWAGA